jgi:hypothetical protein
MCMKTYRLLYETSIYDYLVWEPQGRLKHVADTLDTFNKFTSTDLFRGMSKKELTVLQRHGKVTSKGKGNTRNIYGSYIASDFKLSARFALVNYRDTGDGVVIVVDRNKLPDLKTVDDGNFVTTYIPIEAVKQIIDLSKL